MDLTRLTNESFAIFLFLAPGYLGFRVYLIDKPWNALNAVHIFYGSLVFSTLAYTTIYSLPVRAAWRLSWTGLSVSTTVLAVFYGIVWRLIGHPLLHAGLKSLGITTEDNAFTPWTAIFNNTRIHLTQMIVHLKDGRSVQLDDAGAYHIPHLMRARIFPYYSSADGDLSMVVTQTRESNTTDWIEVPSVFIEHPWGLKLSFIPHTEITQVEVRVIPRTRTSSSVSRLRAPELPADS